MTALHQSGLHNTYEVALLVEARLQGVHDGVLGEWASQVNQILHVLGLATAVRLLAKAKGQRLHALARIHVLG